MRSVGDLATDVLTIGDGVRACTREIHWTITVGTVHVMIGFGVRARNVETCWSGPIWLEFRWFDLEWKRALAKHWTGTVVTWETMAWFGTSAVNSSTSAALSKTTSLDSSGSEKKENSEVTLGHAITGDVVSLVIGAIWNEATCWTGAVGIETLDTLIREPTWSAMTCCTGGTGSKPLLLWTVLSFSFHQCDLLYGRRDDWKFEHLVPPIRFLFSF